MEKDAGLFFNATISVEEARKKLRVPLTIEQPKIDMTIKKSFIRRVAGRIFKNHE